MSPRDVQPNEPVTNGVNEGRRDRYRPTREAEARLLLLVDTFSRKSGGPLRVLEGRVKLAKLDFLLRYPHYLRRVLIDRGVAAADLAVLDTDEAPLDTRMVRYRYGPWDPAYFALLGSLIGRGLIEVVPLAGRNGFGYRTTPNGAELAGQLKQDESFESMQVRLRLLRRHLDLSGGALKNAIYELPEVLDATWHQELT
ncbi:hypothetical protein ACH49A_06475 [Micromonospora sediminicola]|uniref:hypothetical protein n=1 Tax=Micromonospora sediminicola TaxID=946078 RepID=UPI0033C9772C